MIIERGKDNRYSASQQGAMGRLVVGDGSTMGKAMERCADLLLEQTAECYAHEQSMSHLSEISPGGEGAYGEDLG